MVKKKTIFVGVSGGVDSSVTAALLQQQGYDVVGVFIRTWQPDFIECTWRDDRRDAMRICAHLGIPFLECDLQEIYKKEVVDIFIQGYKNGITPNPDILCNKYIKFGAFYNWAMGMGADMVATGHYAQVSIDDTSTISPLMRGVDMGKDQSYFLWAVSQNHFQNILFPLGGLEKKDVRTLAEKFGLPTAQKKDSQGICMLGDVDVKTFLQHFITVDMGDVKNEQDQVVGYHDGAVLYTIGERHGFTITEKNTTREPYYIIDKNIPENTLIVSHTAPSFSNADEDDFWYECQLSDINQLGDWEHNKNIQCQVRYHGSLYDVYIESISDTTAVVRIKGSGLVSIGQSIVLYTGQYCLGGGIVESIQRI
ncbi:MAG: tRNA 2-thiouridine(34) synthase MnmA [Candidatus Pacebacteria bacterium]|nr:tRNA 2-thiouridine(34) synthase MnmA [Candidatus Paceibacterota bacterium]